MTLHPLDPRDVDGEGVIEVFRPGEDQSVCWYWREAESADWHKLGVRADQPEASALFAARCELAGVRVDVLFVDAEDQRHYGAWEDLSGRLIKIAGDPLTADAALLAALDGRTGR
jgi:hypothetical protein